MGKETEVLGSEVRLVSLSQQLAGHRLYEFKASMQFVGFRAVNVKVGKKA